MSHLDRPAAVQLSLLPDPQHEQQTRLDQISDRIREKFDGASLQRGSGMLFRSPSSFPLAKRPSFCMRERGQVLT